ncbi:hypothetical protein ScPMuIL_015643 [Solemya velum]
MESLDHSTNQHGLPRYSSDFRIRDISPNYSTEFRDVIYKINPHNLSCRYKQMFETSALKNLRNEYSNASDSQSDSAWAVQVRRAIQSGAISALNFKGCHSKNKAISKWNICPRPHTAGCAGYQMLTLAETRELISNRSQSACAKIMNSKPTNEGLRIAKTVRSNSTCGAAKSVPILSESTPRERVPDDVTGTSISSNIPFEFEHLLDTGDYMRKYRDEYTARRLNLLKPNSTCTCEGRLAPNLVSVTPIFRSFGPYTTGLSKSQEGEEPVIRHQRKTSPVRRRPKKTMDDDDSRKSQHFLLAQNGVLKMEFFTNPLTVQKKSKPPDKGGRTSVCRTRPTIPSNARGSINPTSTDTNDCFLQRQK